ncbi:hypothetical protein WJX72_003644 [[Myrmecia] bisecta]|uniref:Uncharacterized protein n=1 Tax=[Myrmecia] bisecta TaxID=41462 RepID=A0AAW1R5H2_9CHLO
MMYRGTGPGIGTTPISSDWAYGFVDNLCPECEEGSIDLNHDANGRWKVEWFPIPCNVGAGTFHYYIFPGAFMYWATFTVSNTRVPLEGVDALVDGQWRNLTRSFNNAWALHSQNLTFPIQLRLTSILGDTVEDLIPDCQSTTQAGADGSSAAQTSPTPAALSVAGRRLLGV